jgi:alkylation response protein AidB-like acyl-CoA dehydrogenase
MNFDFTPKQEMVRNLAREFAEREVAPYAAENDRLERFPAEIIRKMAPLGFLAGPIPAEYGGMGLDFIAYALLTEEIGRADSSVRTTLSVHVSLVQLTLLRWASDAQKEKYLPALARGDYLGCFALTEPNAGSDPAGMQTTAVRDGDYWVLNGTKTWISNGGVAGLAIVFAQTDRSKGHRGIAAFLVERDSTPGFTAREIKGKLGLRASNTAEILLENCRVPAENLLGEVGQGMRIALSALDNGRYSVAAGCVGIIQGCIDISVKYAQTRYQFGRPIGSFQLVQEMIADMVVDYEAARYLVYRAGHLKNKGVRNTRETSIAKLFASEAAIRAANNAIQIHGGYGYSRDVPAERYWRDARVAAIYEGTTQIQKLIIGRETLGINAIVPS